MMNEGMLWYVTEKENTLETSIEKAIDFFKYKYGYTPQACYVHPDALSSEFMVKNEVKVMPDDKVIKNHIWLEISQK
jgi:hypothetical protein